MRVNQLRKLHGAPSERAKNKITNYLSEEVQEFINDSPFIVMSTSNKQGNCDASPKGGKPGFVKIIDNKTLLIPDIRGNRLLQSTSNLGTNSKAGLLFFIPGNNKMARVNGKVKILEAEEVKAMNIMPEVFNQDETTILIQAFLISVDEAYSHCARALSFSDLWNSDKFCK